MKLQVSVRKTCRFDANFERQKKGVALSLLNSDWVGFDNLINNHQYSEGPFKNFLLELFSESQFYANQNYSLADRCVPCHFQEEVVVCG